MSVATPIGGSAPARSRSTAHRGLIALRPFVAAAMLGPAMWLMDTATIPMGQRVTAFVLWVLCLIPAWHYTGLPTSRRPPIPFLPLYGLTFGLTYALPPVSGADNRFSRAVLNPLVDYAVPIRLAFIGWICFLLAVYVGSGVRVKSSWLFRVRDEDSPRVRRLAFVALYGGIAFELLRVLNRVPVVLNGPVNFAIAIAFACMALLVIAWARRSLSPAASGRLGLAIAMYVFIRLGTGLLAEVTALVMLVVLAAYIGGRRLRLGGILVGVVLALASVAVKGVLDEFREEVWFGGLELSPAERSAYVLTLLGRHIERDGVVETITEGWSATSNRSSSLDIFADVARRTPAVVPYWNGETYLSLVGAFVPRALWPDKPVKQLGQEFGHRYGYLDMEDTYTSINFPMLVEFYANFGELGVIVGMVIVGLVIKTLHRLLNSPGQSTIATAAGLTLLVPLLNIESDFSLVFGGLVLNILFFAIVVASIRIRHRRGHHATAGA